MDLSLTHLVKKAWWRLEPSARRRHAAIHLPPEFKKILARDCARAERTGSHFSLVSFNTDRSKAGLKLQLKLVGLLKKRIRLSDDLGWLSDNQIGVLLYNTDAADAIRFVTGLKDNGLGDIPNFSYNVYTYPYDKPDDAGHLTGFHQKQKFSTGQPLHTEHDQTGLIAARLQDDRLMSDAKVQRGVATTARVDSLSIKAQILRVPLWKRIFDITGAVVALAIFSPVLLIAALYIKRVSPGPVLFKQERLGYSGRVFQMWKLRTMKVDADPSVHKQLICDLLNHNDCPMKKLADDPRIIPLGKLLRKFCIDELPQLINVLRGEMSLVGPRPDPVYAFNNYSNWYRSRFDAVPGMTGLWQISGKNRLSFQQMMRLDIAYARQRSLWLDFKIIFNTVSAILSNAKYDY